MYVVQNDVENGFENLFQRKWDSTELLIKIR